MDSETWTAMVTAGSRVQGERDRLKVELQESERLRQDAFQACETMRQELAKVTLERDEWKTGAEYAQENVRQLRQQVAALEASVEFSQRQVSVLQQEKQDRDARILQWAEVEAERNSMGEQVVDLQAQLEAVTQERDYWKAERNRLRQQCEESQAQLEAAAVTPAQQQDGTAERLERVRQMIREIWGWYTCTDWFDEVERTDAWEHVGELLGRLKREAG